MAKPQARLYLPQIKPLWTVVRLDKVANFDIRLLLVSSRWNQSIAEPLNLGTCSALSTDLLLCVLHCNTEWRHRCARSCACTRALTVEGRTQLLSLPMPECTC